MPKSPATGGLYVHIPFCHARCGYCDFVTFTGKEDRIASYVEQLCCEIDLYVKNSNGRLPATISTIFFGGGTPSLLEGTQVAQILKHAADRLPLDHDLEITMEANPESITEAKGHQWRAAGVNRLSIGLQAMDDVLLKAMDRLHTVAEFQDAYRFVRRAGFHNINIDLIYGFPAQSMAAWQDTVLKTIALNPEHVSLYALGIEDHTPFAAQKVTVDPDLQGDMYAWARLAMAQAGYPQYEISNFARPGQECRHNLIYWRQQDYLAIGTGAVGCLGNERWVNHKTLHAYEQDLTCGRLPRLSIEILTDQVRRFERLMLGLRLREGLEWGEEHNVEWAKSRTRLNQDGHLEEFYPGRWRIAGNSVPFTNRILLPFLEA